MMTYDRGQEYSATYHSDRQFGVGLRSRWIQNIDRQALQSRAISNPIASEL